MSRENSMPIWELVSKRVFIVSPGRLDDGNGKPVAPETVTFTKWAAKAMIVEEVEGEYPPDYTPSFVKNRQSGRSQ